MSETFSPAQDGRAAAIARRLAMSTGKTGLPPAKERVPRGRQADAKPSAEAGAASQSTAVVTASFEPDMPSMTTANSPSANTSGLSGRVVAMERRRILSEGKAALTGHAINLARPSPAPAGVSPQAGTDPALCTTSSCREQARARRAALSQTGSSKLEATPPSRAPRVGQLDYAPKVVASPTQGGQRVTGSRMGRGQQVTGDERGTVQPVSGTQYIAADSGAGWRGGGSKVGLSRTEGGLVVSGSMMRSNVAVTGDEAGAVVTITGEADQRPGDDMTVRANQGGAVPAQFQRQSDPHGKAAFGGNLGRSARDTGSRDRQRERAVEATESGIPITGSALGRSGRVTGDEGGACRPITGSQYMAPARRQAACGFSGGGTAPAAQIGADRPDPVSGTKVSAAQSWGGQRVTGMDVEHHKLVTGNAPGSCALLTGSQYQGRNTVQGWCDPAAADAVTARVERATATLPITGNGPVHAAGVTGIARGAVRDVTGTPYYRAAAGEVAPSADPVAAIDTRFSVVSPQRSAQLRADAAAVQAPEDAGRITGSFAVGGGKVTGNFEFFGRKREGGSTRAALLASAPTPISGEGSNTGSLITGNTWSRGAGVTGVGGASAPVRNPTERSGKPQNFAGATNFKAEPKIEETKQLVTGMFGYFSKTGARVTLSGGAQS